MEELWKQQLQNQSVLSLHSLVLFEIFLVPELLVCHLYSFYISKVCAHPKFPSFFLEYKNIDYFLKNKMGGIRGCFILSEVREFPHTGKLQLSEGDFIRGQEPGVKRFLFSI